MKANVIDLTYVRANNSRIANQLAKADFKKELTIYVSERPARKREGWKELPCTDAWENHNEIWRKTATFYGGSGVWYRD